MNKWILNSGLVAVALAGTVGGYIRGYDKGYKEGMTTVAGDEETLRQIGLYACGMELAEAARANPGAPELRIEGGRCNAIMKALNIQSAEIGVSHE